MEPNHPEEDHGLTTSEAARLLGVAQRTVHTWIQRGSLKSWKTAGGHRRIPMSEINDILRKRQTELTRHGQVSLLLVEDDADLVMVFREVVAAWKIPAHLMVADNGYDGLIKAGLHKPDLIIVDLLLPAMDGFQMIRQLRATPDLKSSTVLVITALSDEQIAQRGGLPEGIQVLHKPVSFKRLKEIVLGMPWVAKPGEMTAAS